MGCPRLQGLSILHHRFKREGIDCTGKSLRGRLFPFDGRDCEIISCEFLINIEHLKCSVHGFRRRGMGGVAFLPEELTGSQKDTSSHFPPDHITPLVDEEGEIAVTADPL